MTLTAAANGTVQPRSGTVTIARQTFTVRQKAQVVEVEYDTKLFGTDGGEGSFQVYAAGNVSWTAVASDRAMIAIFEGLSGKGDGTVRYIVTPYVGDGEARTETITVGDKVVYITQRGYDLSINPNGAKVEGNNGAGEFGVAAGIADIWRAIVTEPWITVISGYDPVTGSGTVRFIYTDNDTGETRTGKIIVAGEVFTLEQKAWTAKAFPDADTDDEVAAALEGAGDARLAERLKTVADYDAVRAWVEAKGLDPWAVKASAHAWPSYLLGAGTLFQNEPEIVLGGVEVATGSAKAVGGKAMMVAVTVKDGGIAVAVDATKLAALFRATRDICDWTATAALAMSVKPTGEADGSATFEIVPDGPTGQAFLRIAE